MLKKISFNAFIGCCLSIAASLLSLSVNALDTAQAAQSLASAVSALENQQNTTDGGWGEAETSLAYLYTAASVEALAATNQRTAAYYRGIAWLENHNANNNDIKARKLVGLENHGNNLQPDIDDIISAQVANDAEQLAWGLSAGHFPHSLETALVLRALRSALVTDATVNSSHIVNYLLAQQQPDGGWSLQTSSDSDHWITAEVAIALNALPATAAITDALNQAGVFLKALDANSDSHIVARTALALFFQEGISAAVDDYAQALLGRQSINGEWEHLLATASSTTLLGYLLDLNALVDSPRVVIADEVLQRHINTLLGHSAYGTVSQTDLQALTTLDLSEVDVENLEGLQYASNLSQVIVGPGTNVQALADTAAEVLLASDLADPDGDGVANYQDFFPQDLDNNINSSDWTWCGDEGDKCHVPVAAMVRYGANSVYAYRAADTVIDCDSATFGDVLNGVTKHCHYILSHEDDYDGDGVVDLLDAFPKDNTESVDSDGDGVGDNSDAFPTDPNETQDSDGDGMGDNSDPFPADSDNRIDDPGWTSCASEWHFCSPPAPAYVRYGVDGQYAYRYANDSIHCVNSVFSDPLPGFVKHCEYLLSDQDDFDGDGVVDSLDALPADATETLDSDKDGVGNNADLFPYDPDNNVSGGWTFCGDEWSSCSVPVPAEVRYGADGQYATQQVQDAIACTNSAFGGDPIFGVLKTCSYSLSSTADFDGDGVVDSLDAFPADSAETLDSDNDGIGDNSDVFPQDATNNPSANWVHCADDNALCQVPARAFVRYGAGSQYVFAVVTDVVQCSTSVFGNPAPNLTRSCSYIVIDSLVNANAATNDRLSASQVAVTTLTNTANDSQFNSGTPERIRSELMGSPSYMMLSPVRKTLNGIDVSIEYMVHEPVVSAKGIVLLIAGEQLDAQFSVDADGNLLSAGDDFLVRSSHLFAAQGYKVVTMSHPSDRADDVGDSTQGHVYDNYRNSMRHAVDVSRIINTENQNGLPVFISGTDRGAISAMALSSMVNAIGLTSPITSGVYVPINAAHFDFANVNRTMYSAWHNNDACSVSTPTGAMNLNNELIAAGVDVHADAFAGGFDDPLQINPCENDTVHSFFGVESGVVENITAWYDSLLSTLPRTHPTANAVTLAVGTAAIDLHVLSAGEGSLTYSLPFTASSLGGSLTLSHGVVSYSPPVNSVATEDSFVYIVKDGNGGVNHNVVTIPLQ